MMMPRPLHLLYADADMVAVYKPAGWLVHRSALAGQDTGPFVLQSLHAQLGQAMWPVHRLDRGTCGLLLFARHAEACRRLQQAWQAQEVEKSYLAVVRGWLPAPWQTVDHALRPDDAPAHAPAQNAQTRLRALAHLDWPEAFNERHASTRLSLVQAQPLTGRRHQIRRHLKHVSHPIIGDASHGKGPLNRWWAAPERLGAQRLWLHASALHLRQPMTGQALHIETDFNTLAALPHVPEARQWQSLLALPQWRHLATCSGGG